MTGYNELVKKVVFSLDDVEKLAGNRKTASSMLSRLTAKGLVKKIRKNTYTCVNPATGEVVASRYQIACAVSSSAYLSHHSAFEFFGLANQVYYEVYVASETRFREFEFEGISYKRISPRIHVGVIEPRNTEGIRVTDLERTVVDSIRDFEKIGGLEELLACLSSIPFLEEQKLRQYLDAYGIQVLYQKVGYLLHHYRHDMQLSDGFFEYCKSQTGLSTRYLAKNAMEDGVYNSEWQLVVPESIIEMTEQGGGGLV